MPLKSIEFNFPIYRDGQEVRRLLWEKGNTVDKGIWPVNEYTEGLPIPPGTVAWATLDTEHENCSVNLTGISDDDYSEYMEVLNQEGFSVIENVSEEIEEGNYVSIGTLLSNEDKWLSISYIPDSLTIYISFDNN